MNKKKIIVPVVITAAAICAIGGYKVYQDQHSKVDVIPLSSLNYGYQGSDQSLYGIVYDSENQSITLDGTTTVSEVYVTQGQEVKAGDPLLAYDIQDLQLSVEMKKLAVEQAQNQLQGAQSKLKILQNTKPVEPVQPSTPDPIPVPTTVPSETPEKGENGLYSYVNSMEDAYPDEKGIYHFPCTADATISAVVLKQAAQKAEEANQTIILSFDGYTLSNEQFDSTRITKDDNPYQDKAVSQWVIKAHAGDFNDLDDSDSFNLLPKNNDVVPATPSPEPTEQPVIQQDGYTAEELADAIRDTQANIRSYDLDVRRKQLDLDTAQKALSDGIVYAQKDGVVTKVSDPANPPQDGSAFLTVSAQGGTVIQGTISELMRDKLKQGDTLSASDWNSGNTYDAVVQSVDTIPVNNSSYYGGNPNSSYYNFYAVINDANDLTAGTGVDLSLPAIDDSQGYWIDSAYVRKDNGQYYVMKDDGNGRLKRQNVTVGATMWGAVINIKDGLQDEDMLAFPYGKNVREGVRTQESGGGMVG